MGLGGGFLGRGMVTRVTRALLTGAEVFADERCLEGRHRETAGAAGEKVDHEKFEGHARERDGNGDGKAARPANEAEAATLSQS